MTKETLESALRILWHMRNMHTSLRQAVRQAIVVNLQHLRQL